MKEKIKAYAIFRKSTNELCHYSGDGIIQFNIRKKDLSEYSKKYYDIKKVEIVVKLVE
jgi:hypothetical protein